MTTASNPNLSPAHYRIHEFVLRELARQTLVHDRILRLRLYYYYNLRRLTNSLWMILRDVINNMESKGQISRFHRDRAWFVASGVPAADADAEYARKKPIYDRWVDHEGGPHLERLMRSAFRLEGYSVADNPVPFTFTDPNGQVRKREVDVLVFSPVRVALECKNKLSDVFHSPDIFTTPNHDHLQIRDLFSLYDGSGFTPILTAPLIDASFFGFATLHHGLGYRTLFQYLPPTASQLCQDIRTEFRIGHVTTADANDPPPRVRSWIRRIPSMVARY